MICYRNGGVEPNTTANCCATWHSCGDRSTLPWAIYLYSQEK